MSWPRVAAPTATWASPGQPGKEAKQPQPQPLAAPSPCTPRASLQPHADTSHRHANPHPSPSHPPRTRAAPNPHLPPQPRDPCGTLNLVQTPALRSPQAWGLGREGSKTPGPGQPTRPCAVSPASCNPSGSVHPMQPPRPLSSPSPPRKPAVRAPRASLRSRDPLHLRVPPPLGSPRAPPRSPLGRRWRCRRGAPPSGGGGAGCKAAARAGGAHSGAGGGGCGRCGRPIPARERGRGTPWPLHGAGGWAGGQSAGGEAPRGFERFVRSPTRVRRAVRSHPPPPPATPRTPGAAPRPPGWRLPAVPGAGGRCRGEPPPSRGRAPPASALTGPRGRRRFSPRSPPRDVPPRDGECRGAGRGSGPLPARGVRAAVGAAERSRSAALGVAAGVGEAPGARGGPGGAGGTGTPAARCPVRFLAPRSRGRSPRGCGALPRGGARCGDGCSAGVCVPLPSFGCGQSAAVSPAPPRAARTAAGGVATKLGGRGAVGPAGGFGRRRCAGRGVAPGDGRPAPLRTARTPPPRTASTRLSPRVLGWFFFFFALSREKETNFSTSLRCHGAAAASFCFLNLGSRARCQCL